MGAPTGVPARPAADPAWKLNLRPWDGEDDAVLALDAALVERAVHLPADCYAYIGRDFYLRRFLRARGLDVELVRPVDPPSMRRRSQDGPASGARHILKHCVVGAGASGWVHRSRTSLRPDYCACS
jgi:hypothetical protein